VIAINAHIIYTVTMIRFINKKIVRFSAKDTHKPLSINKIFYSFGLH